MLVAFVDSPHDSRTGDWYYRTHAPGRALAALPDVYVVALTNLHAARDLVFERADVVVLNMVCDADLFPLIAARRARGQVTIFEVNDDVAALQAWNPLAPFYADPHNVILFRMLVAGCDGLQVTSSELLRRYGRWNARQAVFPNQMDRAPLPRAPRTADSPLVIGWGGSLGHLEDLAAVAPALTAFVRERADVRLAVMAADPLWELFAGVPAAKKVRTSTGDIDAYHAFVASLDVGLAPLVDTPFNRCRSDVKYLEYALGGAAPVLARLEPYLATATDGVTAVLFDGPDDLIVKLHALADDRARVERIGTAAQAYVVRERLLAGSISRRLDFVVACGARSSGGAEAFSAVVALHAGAIVEGRHASLPPGRYERLLLEATALARDEGGRQEARARLDEAAGLQPALAAPWLLAAYLEEGEAKVPILLSALERAPRSLEAWLELGDALRAVGDGAGALTAYRKAIELAPGYDAAYGKLAFMMDAARDDTRARLFAEQVDKLQAPFR